MTTRGQSLRATMGLKNNSTSVTMSSMQPDEFGQPQQQPSDKQLFPPYQAPHGEPQPYMGVTDPSLPSPQGAGYSTVSTMVAHQNHSKPVGLIVGLVLSILFAIGMGLFASWAYSQMMDYKNNSDKKSAAAVEVAVKKESDRKDSEFIDKEKQPYKTYKSPDATGAIKVTYPKTWSGYVEETGDNTPVEAYWHPNVVPGLQSGTAYALRLTVDNKSYADYMQTFDSQVKAGKVKVAPYVPKNVANVTGSRVSGEISQGKNVTMIVLPLRDKTILLYTESPDFVSDFDNIVLANLNFTP